MLLILLLYFFRKKLKTTIVKYFNLLTETVDEFLNQKQLTQLKVITHTNDIVKINCAQGAAIVFEFKNKFYPTLFTIWTFPHIFPRLQLDNNGKSQLKSTLELTIKDLTSTNNDHILSSLPVDQCVSLCTTSCQKIIAIGYLIIAGSTIKDNEKSRDKCLKVLHYYDDELFKLHIKSIIPDVIFVMEREFKSAPELDNDTQIHSECIQTVCEKMDELLMTCSLKALKYSIKKEMLPILASTFYKKYVMSFCPEGTELDIKKTSFIKLSTFLQLLDKEKIINLNVGSNGIVEIIRVICSNSKFQDINCDENPELKENIEFSPPIKEVYVVTPGLYPIFSEFAGLLILF